MELRQKQAIEAYKRVQRFLNTHPLQAPLSYGAPKEMLDEVVARLTDHSMNQMSGGRQGRADTRRQQALKRELRELHLRPIAKIAKAMLRDAPGIDVALRIPNRRLPVTQLVADARAVRDAVTAHHAVFVASNLPEDFLGQLDAAIGALENSLMDRAENVGTKVGARIGIEHEIRRGRNAVEMLDAFCSRHFVNEPDVLGEFLVAKRVQAVPGGGVPAGSGSSTDDAPVRPRAA